MHGDTKMTDQKTKPRVICLNRHPAYDDDTFSCSLFGYLVSRQCCEECMEKARKKLEEKEEVGV